MEQTTTKPKKPGTSPTGRKIGYLIAIIFLLVFLYIFNHLYEWGLSFLTEDYHHVLWYIQLSIYASIFIHVIFFVYDEKWFRHLLKAGANVFSSLSIIMIYVIYPFDFGSASVDKIIKIVLLVVMIISLISIVTELFQAVKNFRRRV